MFRVELAADPKVDQRTRKEVPARESTSRAGPSATVPGGGRGSGRLLDGGAAGGFEEGGGGALDALQKVGEKRFSGEGTAGLIECRGLRMD
jgi:hypothetical protein